jgi:hypothetical protein
LEFPNCLAIIIINYTPDITLPSTLTSWDTLQRVAYRITADEKRVGDVVAAQEG